MSWFSKKEKTVDEIMHNFKLENHVNVAIIAKRILTNKGVYEQQLDKAALNKAIDETENKVTDLLLRKIHDAVKETKNLKEVDMSKLREATERELS